MRHTIAAPLVLLALLTTVATVPAHAQDEPVTIRVATFNIHDVRTADLLRDDQPRVRRLAEVLQRLRPTIVLLNEIAYDEHGVPGTPEDQPEGSNARRFIDSYLAVPQAEGLAPLRYKAVMLPSNTGRASGLDLDRNGKAVTTYPVPAPADASGSVPDQTPQSRAYGNDCWGFGEFPGQYAMALLVDERLEILENRVRTFRLLPWSAMPDARRPTNPDGTPWHDDKIWNALRLSSKSHWDVPVRLPNGSVVHLLCSHPTPPAFDGPEGRNKDRNFDEIRFWDDYLDNRAWIADDDRSAGGLSTTAMFIILGDLNADPDEGTAADDPIGRLLRNPRVQHVAAPRTANPIDGLDPDDTASFGLRVDYVLPSRRLDVQRSGIWTWSPPPRGGSEGFPSDHFPVWAEISVPLAR